MLNLTPHIVNVLNVETGVEYAFKSNGVARVATTQEVLGVNEETDVKVVATVYGDVEGYA